MKVLILTLLLSGCASFGTDYSRFQEANMCMDGPTRLYRDSKLDVCWFVIGKSIVTAECSKLNRIPYCPPVAPTEEAAKPEDKKPAEKPAK